MQFFFAHCISYAKQGNANRPIYAGQGTLKVATHTIFLTAIGSRFGRGRSGRREKLAWWMQLKWKLLFTIPSLNKHVIVSHCVCALLHMYPFAVPPLTVSRCHVLYTMRYTSVLLFNGRIVVRRPLYYTNSPLSDSTFFVPFVFLQIVLTNWRATCS